MRLLIVCCHGVYHQGVLFAERPSERQVYELHIKKSIEALTQGQCDVLMFSGGYTRREVQKSEARGYFDWARDLGLINETIEKEIVLEEFARSSLENLLFSICRFYQLFLTFPKKVIVCTLFWKRRWFKEVLAPALRISIEMLETGEEELFRKSAIAFPDPQEVVEDNKRDPFGILSLEKIQRRDPWKKTIPYSSSPLKTVFQQLEKMKELKILSLPQHFKFPWELESL